MMDTMESTGEPSSKGRENGDGESGSERPLKKARFAWQVKGKYHLKNETDKSNKNLTRLAEFSTSESSSTSQDSSSIRGNKVENYPKKQDYSKLDSVINSDNSTLTSVDNLTTDQCQYPRYISTNERTSGNGRSNCCNSIKTMSMSYNAEAQCIAQWQVKQLRKGYLDNTLNRLLELWTSDPLPEQAGSQFFAHDFAEFINNLPGDNSVENEGILMAISAHGLQNTSSSNSNDASPENCSISNAYAFDFPSQCSSPVVSDDDLQSKGIEDCSTENKIPNEQDWQTDRIANDDTPFAYYSEPSQSPYRFYDNHQSSNPDSLDADSHFDFMNAAVLYAIQSKGLTASGTEYG